MRDKKLFRLVNKLYDACDREDRGADEIEAIDTKPDQLRDRLRKRLTKAEAKQERRTKKGSRLFEEIIATRAKSVDGMLAKVQARKRWNCDDEGLEVMILNSLVEDIKAIAGK